MLLQRSEAAVSSSGGCAVDMLLKGGKVAVRWKGDCGVDMWWQGERLLQTVQDGKAAVR
jgi:hypothetical protein